MTGAADVAVVCLMALSLVVYVGEPLVRRAASRLSGREDDDSTAHLLLQKETLYGAIRDLEFDFHTGKVDQKDYDELRQQLEGEAIHILRQLDVVDPLLAFDNEVEQQVRQLRQRRAAPTYGAGRVRCTGCRIALDGDESFCPSCGQAVRLA